MRIQLVGINIPEEKQDAAKQYTKSVLKRGLYVTIEPETQAMENYESIPAYVFIQGNKMLNLVLVEKGLADLNLDEVIKYKSNFIEIQEKIQVEEIEIIEEKEN